MNNLWMREVPNGCIIIDAQPHRLVARRECPLMVCKHTPLIRFKSPETPSYAFEQSKETEEGK